MAQTTPADTHHLLPRYRTTSPAAHTTTTSSSAAPASYRSTPLGDPAVLRGIPALAPGVGGAINGTRPGANLDD